MYRSFLRNVLRPCGRGLALLCAASLGKQRVVHLTEKNRTSLVGYCQTVAGAMEARRRHRKEIAVVRARRGVAVLINPVSIAVELEELSSFLFLNLTVILRTTRLACIIWLLSRSLQHTRFPLPSVDGL